MIGRGRVGSYGKGGLLWESGELGDMETIYAVEIEAVGKSALRDGDLEEEGRAVSLRRSGRADPSCCLRAFFARRDLSSSRPSTSWASAFHTASSSPKSLPRNLNALRSSTCCPPLFIAG